MTQMEIEARQTPECVARQLVTDQKVIEKIAEHLAKNPPPFALTIARGSSDHAATFAKYLLEIQLGLVTASAAPSVQTLYDASLKLNHALVIAISQSGKSEDICTTMQMARDNHAVTVAIVNDANSPLAKIAEYVIDICAGTELAVAATKSYICSLTALSFLVSKLNPNKQLNTALQQLPEKLAAAAKSDWSEFIDCYQTANNSVVIGRGYGFPIAQESALKFKETCSIQAEPFSSAEFIHGPLALVKNNYPILLYAQSDKTYQSIITLVNKANELGANTLLAAPADLAHNNAAKYYLPLPKTLHPILDPIMAIQAFYPAIAKLAVARGFNPDKPANLNKVTSTK